MQIVSDLAGAILKNPAVQAAVIKILADVLRKNLVALDEKEVNPMVMKFLQPSVIVLAFLVTVVNLYMSQKLGTLDVESTIMAIVIYLQAALGAGGAAPALYAHMVEVVTPLRRGAKKLLGLKD